MRTRTLVTGILSGALGAVLLLGAVAALGQVLGAIAGILAASAVGGSAAWLILLSFERELALKLSALVPEDPGEERTALEPIGLPAIDERLEIVAQLLQSTAQIRRDYEEAERAALALRGAINGKASANGSRQGLLGLLDHLRQTTSALARDAEALAEVNEKMASGAVEQSETVSRTAGTVEALSDKIDRISQNAEEAAEACERTLQEARRGLEQVHTVIEGFDRLRTQVEANGRKARRLGDRSMEIGTIVELIRGISSRTDMLALNATIESVRAGEHGRGFAVVAEEIRKLAERTADATREIGTLVEAIQADTHESIRALAEEQSDMEQEAERVRAAGAALERISGVAEHSAVLVDGISRSSNDQVIATQDLVRAMQRISEVSFATQEATTKTRDLLNTLSQRCEPIQRLSLLDVPFVSKIRDGQLASVKGSDRNGTAHVNGERLT